MNINLSRQIAVFSLVFLLFACNKLHAPLTNIPTNSEVENAMSFSKSGDMNAHLNDNQNPAANFGWSATGSGHSTFGGLTPQGRRFAFSAINQPNGDVSGQYQLLTADGIMIHGKVICVTVEGNVARIGGIVDPTNFPIVSGTQSFFTVVDRGEGKHTPPDLISYHVSWTGDPELAPHEFHCNEGVTFDPNNGQIVFDGSGVPLLLFEVERGNIQVR